jgi:hypothetical protein
VVEHCPEGVGERCRPDNNHHVKLSCGLADLVLSLCFATTVGAAFQRAASNRRMLKRWRTCVTIV